MTNILEHVTNACVKLVSKARLSPNYGIHDIELLKLMSTRLLQSIKEELGCEIETTEMTHRDLLTYTQLIENAINLIHTIGEPDVNVLTFINEVTILNTSVLVPNHFAGLEQSSLI